MAGFHPPPIGLNLRKTESLLDLCGRLAFAPADFSSLPSSDTPVSTTVDAGTPPQQSQDKVKAANFAADSIQIGSWKCDSLREEDIVAKFYYAKRKLIWEVLVGERKRKFEIQWADIASLHATFPDGEREPGTLVVEVSKPPLFFTELEPKPRMHTSWQACEDFTGEEATVNRHHILQVPSHVLRKHFQRLINADSRLWSISRVGSSTDDFFLGNHQAPFSFEAVMIQEKQPVQNSDSSSSSSSSSVTWNTHLSRISEYLFEESDGTLLSFQPNSWLGDDHQLLDPTSVSSAPAATDVYITRKSSAGDLRTFMHSWAV